MIKSRPKRIPKTLLTIAIALAVGVLPVLSQSAPQATTSPVKESYLFQVVLLEGGRDHETLQLDEVPRNVHAALQDISDFLPYTSYRPLDVALIRSDETAIGALSGPDEQDLGVRFRFERQSPGQQQLWVEQFEVVRLEPGQSMSYGFRVAPRAATTDPGQQLRAEDLFRAAAAQAQPLLLSSSFSVNVGETIVVGASKLDGHGKALIVLLTPIPGKRP